MSYINLPGTNIIHNTSGNTIYVGPQVTATTYPPIVPHITSFLDFAKETWYAHGVLYRKHSFLTYSTIFMEK